MYLLLQCIKRVINILMKLTCKGNKNIAILETVSLFCKVYTVLNLISLHFVFGYLHRFCCICVTIWTTSSTNCTRLEILCKILYGKKRSCIRHSAVLTKTKPLNLQEVKTLCGWWKLILENHFSCRNILSIRLAYFFNYKFLILSDLMAKYCMQCSFPPVSIL